MAEFPLTAAQRAAVEHRGSALLLAAGAGSGKTRVLVERLLDRICRDGLDIDEFLLITYTRAAAAELRSRIQEALTLRLRDEPQNRQLRRQAALVGQAPIGTIHSLCASLLREYAALCGIRPDFRQADEAEQAILKNEVVEELLQSNYETMTERFRLLADTMGAGTDDKNLVRLILSCDESVQSHPKPEAWLNAQQSMELPDGDAAETLWGAMLLASAKRKTEYWAQRLEAALSYASEDEKLYEAYAPAFTEVQGSLRQLREAMDRGWDAASEFGEIVYPRLRSVRGMASNPSALAAKRIWNGCKKRMAEVTELFADRSEGLLADMRQVKPLTDELFRLTAEFGRAYGAEKQRRGILDFSDLEHMALDLLTNEDGSRSETAKQLAPRFREILVDEYQDCNRVQELIFQALSQDGRNLTMVGDVKQSIYRFRLADPGIFLEKYAHYSETPAEGEGRLILLSENFRSDAGVLRAVNQLFSRIMSTELGELNYGEAEALRAGAKSDTPTAFELRLIETAGEDEAAIKVEARAVANRIDALLHSGMRVGDRPLMPGDIAVLLRSARGRDAVFAAALEEKGIGAVCRKAGEGLSQRREVQWAINLLKTIDNPRQDIPLIASLSGPVWSFTAEQLAEVRCADKKGCFYDALNAFAAQNSRGAEVLRELEDYRLLAAELPTDRLLTELFGRTGLMAAAEARENGSSVWLEELIRYAGELETNGVKGLFRFLQRLRDAAKQQLDLSAASDGGGSGVRITTIHASKGLEYPVVILADLSRRFHRTDNGEQLLLHPVLGAGAMLSDTERGICYPTLARMACAERLRRETLSEEMRVLYVGMTRAKQKLLAFCRCRSREKTVADLTPYAEDKIEPQALADCGSMGDWLLLAALAQREEGAWQILGAPPDLDKEPEISAKEEEKTDEGLVCEIQNALNWQYSHKADIPLPSKLTATALRETSLQSEAAEGAERLNAKPLRSRFREPELTEAGKLTAAQKGTALHIAMQFADPKACISPESAAAELKRLTELHQLRPEQAAAVKPEQLSRFYSSELGRRILCCEALHREFKFSVLMPAEEYAAGCEGEILLQGVIDCWLEEADGITIVDYKTDYVTKETQSERAKEYTSQLMAYQWAIERMTGKPVRECLIYFFATNEFIRVENDKK